MSTQKLNMQLVDIWTRIYSRGYQRWELRAKLDHLQNEEKNFAFVADMELNAAKQKAILDILSNSTSLIVKEYAICA